MYLGHSGKRLGADNLCAVRDIPKSTLWNMGCKKIPLFGDVVKIQTSSQILALCEVEIYAEPYGKTINSDFSGKKIHNRISFFKLFYWVPSFFSNVFVGQHVVEQIKNIIQG